MKNFKIVFLILFVMVLSTSKAQRLPLSKKGTVTVIECLKGDCEPAYECAQDPNCGDRGVQLSKLAVDNGSYNDRIILGYLKFLIWEKYGKDYGRKAQFYIKPMVTNSTYIKSFLTLRKRSILKSSLLSNLSAGSYVMSVGNLNLLFVVY